MGRRVKIPNLKFIMPLFSPDAFVVGFFEMVIRFLPSDDFAIIAL
jgi:hypothetical protein